MRTVLFSCLAAIVLVVSACASTTVVARDNRAQAEPTPAPALDDSETAPTDEPTAEDVATTDTAEEEAADASADDADAGDGDDAAGSPSDEDEPETIEAPDGFGLGGAEQLASLLSDCDDGDNYACDVLFQLSAFDSPEEEAALTCGGRSPETVVFCTPDVQPDGDQAVFDLSSPGLEAAATDCVDERNMSACDFLYFRSPVGSELEELGATCGNRVEVAIPDCRTSVVRDS